MPETWPLAVCSDGASSDNVSEKEESSGIQLNALQRLGTASCGTRCIEMHILMVGCMQGPLIRTLTVGL